MRYGCPQHAGCCALTAAICRRWASDAKHAIHPTIFDGSDGFRMHAMLTGYSPVVKKAPDGKLWFAHNDGVSAIDPRNLRLNKVPPPVHVEQITADGKTYAASTVCDCRRASAILQLITRR